MFLHKRVETWTYCRGERWSTPMYLYLCHSVPLFLGALWCMHVECTNVGSGGDAEHCWTVEKTYVDMYHRSSYFFVAFDDSGSSVVYCCHICTGVRAKLCASSFAALISFTMSDAPGPPPESGCCETGQQWGQYGLECVGISYGGIFQ